jgi:hypothetical protein
MPSALARCFSICSSRFFSLGVLIEDGCLARLQLLNLRVQRLDFAGVKEADKESKATSGNQKDRFDGAQAQGVELVAHLAWAVL